MGSYSALHLAVDFQLTVNDDEMGIYYAACKPRTWEEGRKVRQQNHSEVSRNQETRKTQGFHL